MGKAELAEHEVRKWGRDYAESDDGYSDMAAEEKRGWSVIASWGSDGWDLGHWPYVMIYTREAGGHPLPPIAPAGPGRFQVQELAFELLEIVEGDRTLWQFGTEDDRTAAIDYLFLWYAAHEGHRWSPVRVDQQTALEAGDLPVDEKFRGPFRSGAV